MLAPVEFRSDGDVLRGRLYQPASSLARRPAVVMTAGFGATITMATDRYAEALCEVGFTVLLYDHAGFGVSDGEPRQQVNPWRQIEGYRSAVTFLEQQPFVDARRIALWGKSYSASVALIAAATDERVAAVIALLPALGPASPPDDQDGSLFTQAREIVGAGSRAWPPGVVHGPMPIVTADPLNTSAVVPVPSAFRWSIEYGGRHGSGWQNYATVVRPDDDTPLHAGFCSPHLKVPSLWLIAPEDEVPGANPDVAKHAYQVAGGAKELATVDGGHFGALSWPSDTFTECVRVQVIFLSNTLGQPRCQASPS